MCAAAAMCSASAAATRCSAARIADPRRHRGPRRHGRGPRPARRRDRHDRRQIDQLGQRPHCATGAAIEGYEIHLGRTEGGDCARPLLTIDGRADGASSADGRVQGTYVHGLFTGDAFRKAWLAHFGIASSLAYEARIEAALDALADIWRRISTSSKS